MPVVSVSLRNEEGLTFCMSVKVPFRNTPYENAACAQAVALADASPEHGRYKPWAATSSRFESA